MTTRYALRSQEKLLAVDHRNNALCFRCLCVISAIHNRKAAHDTCNTKSAQSRSCVPSFRHALHTLDKPHSIPSTTYRMLPISSCRGLSSVPKAQHTGTAMQNQQTRDHVESKISLLLIDKVHLQNDQRSANQVRTDEYVIESMQKLDIDSKAKQGAERRAAHRHKQQASASKQRRDWLEALRAEEFVTIETLLIKRRKQLQKVGEAAVVEQEQVHDGDPQDGPKCGMAATAESEDEEER